jgi:hypothetical protein
MNTIGIPASRRAELQAMLAEYSSLSSGPEQSDDDDDERKCVLDCSTSAARLTAQLERVTLQPNIAGSETPNPISSRSILVGKSTARAGT